jgi:hypothetical protein
MRLLKQNTAVRITVGPFLDKTDGITPETALTATTESLTFIVDNSDVPTLIVNTTATASGGANDMIHVSNDVAGFYDLELAASNVNYVGRAMLSVNNTASHCPVFHEFELLSANVYDAIRGADLLDVSMTQILGAAVVTTTAQVGVNVLQVNGTAQTAKDLGASATQSADNTTYLTNATYGLSAIYNTVSKPSIAQVITPQDTAAATAAQATINTMQSELTSASYGLQAIINTVSKPSIAQTITAPADMALQSTLTNGSYGLSAIYNTVSKPSIAQIITPQDTTTATTAFSAITTMQSELTSASYGLQAIYNTVSKPSISQIITPNDTTTATAAFASIAKLQFDASNNVKAVKNATDIAGTDFSATEKNSLNSATVTVSDSAAATTAQATITKLDTLIQTY